MDIDGRQFQVFDFATQLGQYFQVLLHWEIFLEAGHKKAIDHGSDFFRITRTNGPNKVFDQTVVLKLIYRHGFG